MQLHAVYRYFKGDKSEVSALLGLLSEKLDIGTAFDKFRDKLKGYVDINIDNQKDVLCVVTDMEDAMNCFEEDNMPEYLVEYEAKSVLKNKSLELELMRYMDIK